MKNLCLFGSIACFGLAACGLYEAIVSDPGVQEAVGSAAQAAAQGVVSGESGSSILVQVGSILGPALGAAALGLLRREKSKPSRTGLSAEEVAELRKLLPPV